MTYEEMLSTAKEFGCTFPDESSNSYAFSIFSNGRLLCTIIKTKKRNRSVMHNMHQMGCHSFLMEMIKDIPSEQFKKMIGYFQNKHKKNKMETSLKKIEEDFT